MMDDGSMANALTPKVMIQVDPSPEIRRFYLDDDGICVSARN